MTNTVIKTVQDIEHDFGSVNFARRNDRRLNKLHKWWLNHPDAREVDVYEVYKNGEYFMTGTAKEISKRIGLSTSIIYSFNSELYKMRKHEVFYELVKVNE